MKFKMSADNGTILFEQKYVLNNNILCSHLGMNKQK